jgi:HemK-related putative methylase
MGNANTMKIKELLYDALHPGLSLLRSNRQIIRWLFGIRMPRDVTAMFDPTTVLLKYALRRISRPDDRIVLEVGIGQAALVSLSLAKKRKFVLHGIDCSAERVVSSRKVASYNRLDATFFVSDLFSHVSTERPYDVICFNPPYVPTHIGKRLKLTERLRLESNAMWDGGTDGMDVLRRFLRDCPEFLAPHGRVVFGVQNVFVSDEQVRKVVAASALKLTARITRRLVPSVAYVLQHDSASGAP